MADEFIRRAPSNREAHYLRGLALEGAEDYQRALVDFANAIELFGSDKKGISSRVFMRMASAYAAHNRFCEAMAPINMWVALDPATRDNSQTQKIITDYEAKGNCTTSQAFQKETYPLRGQNVVMQGRNQWRARTVHSRYRRAYVAMKSNFADRAKISQAGAGEITMATANGLTKAKLAKAEKVTLGKLAATNVPVAIQNADAKNYGAGVDGLLGMSFLSRFEVQMANGSIEVRTRRPKK